MNSTEGFSKMALKNKSRRKHIRISFLKRRNKSKMKGKSRSRKKVR
ncbi:MAG: hypothetical protein QXR53_01605 [Candidatus Norongarragalinales archaeon]